MTEDCITEQSGSSCKQAKAFTEGCPGARVPHTQTHLADLSSGDARQRGNVAVGLFPLILQDDVTGAAIPRQGNLTQDMTPLKKRKEKKWTVLDTKLLQLKQKASCIGRVNGRGLMWK